MNARRYFRVTLLLLATTQAFSQKNSITYYDAGGNETMRDYALNFTVKNKINDTSYSIEYYLNKGPLKKKEHYKDKNFTIKHGEFAFYGVGGMVDSAGRYFNNKQEGKWTTYDEFFHPMIEKIYQNGVVIQSTELPDPGSMKQDSANKLLVESQFPGGDKAWGSFMSKNLRIPEDVVNNSLSVRNGHVVVSFTVEADGSIHEILLVKSRLYKLDDAAIDLVKKSPNWLPASIDGVPVLSHKIQPVIFNFQSY